MKRRIITARVGIVAVAVIYFIQGGNGTSFEPGYLPPNYEYEISVE